MLLIEILEIVRAKLKFTMQFLIVQSYLVKTLIRQTHTKSIFVTILQPLPFLQKRTVFRHKTLSINTVN